MFSKKKHEEAIKIENSPHSDNHAPDSTPPKEPVAQAQDPINLLHTTLEDLPNTRRLFADLEKLKAQSEANTELRQLFSEKFSRIDEEIGEIRTMLVDREKDIQSLEATATKATDLVAEVQPEKLMIEVKKQDAKLEALKGKLDSHEQINETMMEELKNLRNSIRAFRGVQEIEKMNRELLEDQTVIKKIESKVEQHSDKVEAMFMEVNKKYDEFRRFREMMDSLNSNFNKVTASFGDLTVKFSNMSSKEDFDKFKNEIKIITDPLKKDEKDFAQLLSDFKELQKQTLPLIKKYQVIDEQQNIAQKDFERYKILLQQKVDEKIRNYEDIIIRLGKESDILKHKSQEEMLQLKDYVEKEVARFKQPIDHLLELSENDTSDVSALRNKISESENEIQHLKVAIARLAQLTKRLLTEIKTARMN